MTGVTAEAKPLVLLKMGDTLAAIREEHGDFDRWFRDGLGLTADELKVVQVHRGEALPKLDAIAGLVVSGSSSMVTDHEPWSERCIPFLQTALSRDLPMLGVCYGHQLMARAFGGGVHVNPRGREIGTIAATLNRAGQDDPLFAGLPAELWMQATHRQSVAELPPHAVLLASNALDPHQIFRVGQRAWGVQFHPEFNEDIVRGYIEGRQDALQEEGLDVAALLAALRSSDHGRRLLRNFVALCHSQVVQ